MQNLIEYGKKTRISLEKVCKKSVFSVSIVSAHALEF